LLIYSISRLRCFCQDPVKKSIYENLDEFFHKNKNNLHLDFNNISCYINIVKVVLCFGR